MNEYINKVIELYEEAKKNIEESDKKYGTKGVGAEVELIDAFIMVLNTIKDDIKK